MFVPEDYQDAPLKWTWQKFVQQSKLESTTKLVLFHLCMYMNPLGGGCYPTIKTQAEGCSLSERAVCTHLAIAVEKGFLRVRSHGFAGQKWKNNEYFPTFPPLSMRQMRGTHEQAICSAEEEIINIPEKGTERGSEGTERDDIKALNDVQSNTPLKHHINTNIYPKEDLFPESKAPSKKKKSKNMTLEEWESVHGIFNLKHIAEWGREKKLDANLVFPHIESFRQQCIAKGYVYANFAAAFKKWGLPGGWAKYVTTTITPGRPTTGGNNI